MACPLSFFYAKFDALLRLLNFEYLSLVDEELWAGVVESKAWRLANLRLISTYKTNNLKSIKRRLCTLGGHW